MTKEKLIQNIMRECEKDGEPVTLEQAAEMAEMELRAKESRHYETSDKPRKSNTRERKVDAAKLYLINTILMAFSEEEEITVTNVKNETEITLTFSDTEYSLKLIRHRPIKS